MTDVTVTVEHEYTYLDTREWFAAVAEDVTDYWLPIVERCARDDESDTRGFYSSQSVSTWNLREARDRVIASLRKRASAQAYYGTSETDGLRGATVNSDTNFWQDFAYDVVELYRGGYSHGVLIFVSLGDYHDSGLDIVLRVDSVEEAYGVLSPKIGYFCQADGVGYDRHEAAETTDGGYSFETWDGSQETRHNVITDGVATCSAGHVVTLTAETYIGG